MGDVLPISEKIVLAHLLPMVTRPPRDLGVLGIGRPAWILVVGARRFISAPPSSFHSVSFLLFRILINAVFIQRSQSSLSSSPSTHPKPQQLYGGDATIPRPRRWVLQLQERADFFDKIRKRRHRIGDGDDGDDEQWISHQYHGVVELNASKCILLGVSPPSKTADAIMSSIPSSQVAVNKYPSNPFTDFIPSASLTNSPPYPWKRPKIPLNNTQNRPTPRPGAQEYGPCLTARKVGRRGVGGREQFGVWRATEIDAGVGE